MDTGPCSIEVLLELMLVDARITLQRDMLASMRPPSEAPATRAPAIIPGTSECDLFVLISRARQLPEVKEPASHGDNSNSRPPSAFVAAKSSRDIVHGGGVQGATRVVSSSCDPTWCVKMWVDVRLRQAPDALSPCVYRLLFPLHPCCMSLLRAQSRGVDSMGAHCFKCPCSIGSCRDEVLVVRYVEKELAHERLVLAIVDDTSAALMASCSIPLLHVAAGHYYNVQVPLTLAEVHGNGAGEASHSTLFVTLCLSNAPCSEVERWRSRKDKAMGVVQLRLASCSAETHAGDADEDFLGVFARVQLGDSPDDSDGASDADSVQAAAEAIDFEDIYIELSGTTAEDNAALQEASSEWDMNGDEIVPILGRSAGVQVWPVSRMLLLALQAGSREESAIVLSLHSVVADEDSRVLGQCTLPIRHLPQDGHGALVPYSSLPFRGGDGVPSVAPPSYALLVCKHAHHLT